MRILKYKAEQLSSVVIPLGVQGETGATLIRINFSDWLLDSTDGYPVITVLDPDGYAYIAATFRADERDIVEEEDGTLSFVDREENTGGAEDEDEHATIVWPITDVDTPHFGDGAMRLLLYNPQGVILKSAVARTNIAPSFMRFEGEPPDQYEFWLRAIEEQTAASGMNRVITENRAAEAARDADAAANSEAAAMAYADIAKLAAAAAAGEVEPSALDTVMNLTTTISFSIATTDWETITGGFKHEITNEIVTGHMAAILMPTAASAPFFQDGVTLDCSTGKITMTTGTKPSNTVAGNIVLCGRYTLDGEEDTSHTFSYWPRRASVSIGTVTSVRFEDGASASVSEKNVLNLNIPAGKNLTIGTVETVAYPGTASATITGDNVLNLALPRGEKGETGDMATNFTPVTAENMGTICDAAFSDEEAEAEGGED